MLKKAIMAVLSFVLDVVQVIKFTFQVAMGKYPKRLKYGAYPVLGAIATATTGVIIAKILSGSFIVTGCAYFFASLEKHIGILWASEGDWSHWMSGGRYLFFKAYKEDLIANNGFAQFLSSLNGNFFMKIFQVAILLLCVACMCYLVYVFCVCFVRTLGTFAYYCMYRNDKRRRRSHRNTSNKASNRSVSSNHEAEMNSNVVPFPGRRNVG